MLSLIFTKISALSVIHRSGINHNDCNSFRGQASAGLFFGHLKKNSRCKKLKTQEKNSKLKLKIQISGTFEEKRNFGKLTETTIIVKRGAERQKF